MEEWYVGDGWYADGQHFAFDYYSSYVFHPMYLESIHAIMESGVRTRFDYRKYYDRALMSTEVRHDSGAFISPEGTFPVFGRSIPYRMATMQHWLL